MADKKVDDIRTKLIDTYGESFFSMFNLHLADFLFDDGHFDLIKFCRAVNGGLVDCVDTVFHKYGREGFLLLNAVIDMRSIDGVNPDAFFIKGHEVILK